MLVLPLYASLPYSQQLRVFQGAPKVSAVPPFCQPCHWADLQRGLCACHHDPGKLEGGTFRYRYIQVSYWRGTGVESTAAGRDEGGHKGAETKRFGSSKSWHKPQYHVPFVYVPDSADT